MNLLAANSPLVHNLNENYIDSIGLDWTKRLDLTKWTQLDSVVSLYYRTQLAHFDSSDTGLMDSNKIK